MPPKEGEDFYINKEGMFVFTETYHIKRGSCCGSGCIHCPYNYGRVPEPRRSELRRKRANEKDSDGDRSI